MHILITANAAWNIWNFRRGVVTALKADGHRITLLAPPDHSTSDLHGLGCKFIPLEMNARGLNPFQDVRLLNAFKAVFKAEQPDVILGYTIKNNIYGCLAARSLRIPFIPNVTGLGTAFLSNRVLRISAEMLYRGAFSAAPIVFFQNKDDLNLFLDRRIIRPEQATLLPGSGVDLRHFTFSEAPPTSGGFVFLMIARLLRDKGVIEFVEAARLVRLRWAATRFRLLGAAGSQNRTAIDAATVQRWVAEGVVQHLGTAIDVRPHIAAAHCVVLPSYREGAPRTLIEAAAMGRPLIASDVPGCRAVVDRDVSGFLCQVRRADSLAAVMQRLIELSEEARAAMGRAGRAKMEREFDESIVVRSYRDAIRAAAPNA